MSGGFYFKDGGVCLRTVLPDSRCVAMPFGPNENDFCDLDAAILVTECSARFGSAATRKRRSGLNCQAHKPTNHDQSSAVNHVFM